MRIHVRVMKLLSKYARVSVSTCQPAYLPACLPVYLLAYLSACLLGSTDGNTCECARSMPSRRNEGRPHKGWWWSVVFLSTSKRKDPHLAGAPPLAITSETAERNPRERNGKRKECRSLPFSLSFSLLLSRLTFAATVFHFGLPSRAMMAMVM